MSIQMVLLPVFVQIGLTFALLLSMVSVRTRALKGREVSLRDIALGQPNWPTRATHNSSAKVSPIWTKTGSKTI